MLFQLKYTALPHAAFLFHPFFLLCGWLSAASGCEIGVIHFAAKAVGVVVFFWLLFKYIDYLGLRPAESIASTLLVGLSSGAGWLLAWQGGPELVRSLRPVDTWLPDANTYWALLWNPLFPYSLALMVLTVFWLDRGTQQSRKLDVFLSGLASGVMALIHPYSQPLLFMLAALVVLVRKRSDSLAYLWRFSAGALPFCLWVAALTLFNPIVSQHSVVGGMKSRGPGSYLFGFGLPLVLAIGGVALGRGQFLRRYWLLITWFGLSIVFAYVPIWFQRKFVFGAHVPLCLLAGVSFLLIIQRTVQPGLQRWVGIAAGVVLLPFLVSTQIYNLTTQNKVVRSNQAGAYYLSDDFVGGLRFLREKTNPRALVFATPAASGLIPAYAGNTVLWGHWAMSVDVKERQKWFELLCSPGSGWDEAKRGQEFWGSGIEYVFADGTFNEAVRASAWPWSVILREADKVFENRSVTIYRHKDKHG
jgi:hypothetical protein